MNVIIYKDEIEKLRPIAKSWEDIANKNDLGVEIDVNNHLLDLWKIITNVNADLLVLFDEKTPVGYLGLTYFNSPVGKQLMANEHYWYVVPESRGVGSMRLIKTAIEVAKLRGCTHIVMNASNLASDLHDKVCDFYEKMNMKLFESSYIRCLDK